MAARHLPRLWRFRIAVAGRFGYHREVFKVWEAQARAEGGSASFNPWNTTEPWPGSTPYNDNVPPVRNYPSARAGIAATVATLRNGHYPDMMRLYRKPGRLTAREIVNACARDFDTWGTGAGNVLRCLP